MTESLYTTSDIKKVRELLVKKQKGVDPILREPFKETIATDHDHDTQHIRAALNRNTNAFEGLVVNAYKRCLKWLTDVPLPVILRNLADYLEQDYSHMPYHTDWLKRVKIDFGKLKESDKDKVLLQLNQQVGKNSIERKKNFQSALLSRKFNYQMVRDIIKSYQLT
jgi:hypothetical protein